MWSLLFFSGQFICEYVGEVLDARQFKKRQKEYHNENIQHHYFMALNKDEVIDATRQGNCTRFTNHSCDPNAETQKVRKHLLPVVDNFLNWLKLCREIFFFLVKKCYYW